MLDHIEQTPTTTGLFFIHNEEGTVLYVGKNKNIQKGINQLFLRTSKKIKKLLAHTHSITTEETGNELLTQLKFYEINLRLKAYNLLSHYKHIQTSFPGHQHLDLLDFFFLLPD